VVEEKLARSALEDDIREEAVEKIDLEFKIVPFPLHLIKARSSGVNIFRLDHGFLLEKQVNLL
jgi:hypothetical protein